MISHLGTLRNQLHRPLARCHPGAGRVIGEPNTGEERLVLWCFRTSLLARKLEGRVVVVLAAAHLDLLYQALGVVELVSHSDLLTKFLAGYTCTAIDGVCGSAISLLFGTSTSLNISHVPVLISQTPAGTFVKDVVHFAQGIREDSFARFDYGCSCVQALDLSLCSSAICKNKAKYGSFEPPAYALGDIVYPRTGLYVGAGDTLTESADIDRLRSSLPSGTVVHDHRHL
ncbi:hypothetical protein PHYPSEUDO_013883 [Phytophthora pseudosyringae]|uniref:Uncharacterized protein n=1 Tax=Phytophthora pseudosyringae TaxID=221518 RepID=A0A8T1W652_9STRA|nr:hypothetical protein PHYPSEUDO_013883 [Phytophthora pseudosyringae]